MTRGIELNNPLNLMENAIHWAFQIRPTRDPEHRLAQFRAIEDGLHAGVENLLNQQLLHGLNTWTQIIGKYAPATENDTAAYIAALCKATDCQPMQTFDLTDTAFLSRAVKAFIIHEQGVNPCTDADIDTAITTVLKAHQKPPPT